MKLGNSISLLDTSSLAEKVYERLLTAITRREFTGGLNLEVDKLAEKFGVSRTPIQGALARLADLGIVEIRPRRGTFVKRLTDEDFHEIFELREIIEIYAVKKGVRSATDGELAVLKDFVQGLERFVIDDEYENYQEFLKWDKQLHSMIAGLAKTEGLCPFIINSEHSLN